MYVTPCIPIKKMQAKITKSSLCFASKTLVFRDKIACSWVRGFFSEKTYIIFRHTVFIWQLYQ